MDFKMKIKYVTGSHSYTFDECHFTPYNDFSDKGPNIWWSSVNETKVFIRQASYRTEISEADIEFEPKIGRGIMTQKHEIVKAFNDYLSKIYS